MVLQLYSDKNYSKHISEGYFHCLAFRENLSIDEYRRTIRTLSPYVHCKSFNIFLKSTDISNHIKCLMLTLLQINSLGFSAFIHAWYFTARRICARKNIPLNQQNSYIDKTLYQLNVAFLNHIFPDPFIDFFSQIDLTQSPITLTPMHIWFIARFQHLIRPFSEFTPESYQRYLTTIENQLWINHEVLYREFRLFFVNFNELFTLFQRYDTLADSQIYLRFEAAVSSTIQNCSTSESLTHIRSGITQVGVFAHREHDDASGSQPAPSGSQTSNDADNTPTH